MVRYAERLNKEKRIAVLLAGTSLKRDAANGHYDQVDGPVQELYNNATPDALQPYSWTEDSHNIIPVAIIAPPRNTSANKPSDTNFGMGSTSFN